MKNVWLPDANVLLCYLLRDIPDKVAVTEDFFENVRSGSRQAILHEGVLAEVVFILQRHYGVPRARLVETLIELLRYKGFVNNDREALICALQIFAEQSLDFVDCILIAHNRCNKHQVLTFDNKIQKLLDSAASASPHRTPHAS